MPDKVTFTPESYLIDGQPVWLLSGEMHYYKLTRGDWRRRLLQLKAAGFNTVSLYLAWNYHELAEGEWDFSGDRDVEYLFALAAELGVYVVARPGPYICDEWQAGGFPPWLGLKPGLRLRTADPQYLAYVDKWFDKVVPLIARYELGREGTVIMAQVENEYGHFGPHQEADYVEHLRAGLRSRGVTVPIINCDSFIRMARLQPRKYDGVNLCLNFGGDAIRNLERARELQPDAPGFVTEYWIAAFDWWGRNGSAARPDAPSVYGALEIAAAGAGGLTAFVFSGGAHFAYWHGCSICSDANFMTTLYGPGAPILDDGRFGPKYNLFKTAMSALVHPELAAAGMPELTQLRPDLLRAVRRGPRATWTFHLNQSKTQAIIADDEKDQACVDMALEPGAVHWTVRDLPVSGGAILGETDLRVLASDPALVLFGQPGAAGYAVVNGERLDLTVPTDDLPAHRRCGDLDVLVLNEAAAPCCWRLDLPGAPTALFGGPERLEDATVDAGALTVAVASRAPNPTWRLGDAGVQILDVAYAPAPADFDVPLRDLAWSPDLPEAAADYADGDWCAAAEPQPMAAFGHGHGFAWYRTALAVETAGPQMIHFSGAADRALVFVDGECLGSRGVHSRLGWAIMAGLAVGEHTLAVLVENLGMFNSGGEFDVALGEPKGLWGSVMFNGRPLEGWRMRAGLAAGESLVHWPKPGPATWDSLPGEAIDGPGWLRGSFSLPEGFDGAVRLDYMAAGEKGSVWVNGHNVGRYWKLGPQESLWLPSSWLAAENEVVIFEERRLIPAAFRVTGHSFGQRAVLTF